MLQKKFDPKIKSKTQNNELESCLQVAVRYIIFDCRWGLINIVKLLLEKVDYLRNEITEVLLTNSVSPPVRKLISNYKEKKFDKKSCCLPCK